MGYAGLMPDAMCIAYISLGSNLGDSPAILQAAISRLQEFSDELIAQSSLWQSTPVDCPPGSPLFLNAVVGLRVRAGESPETLLRALQALEVEFGRRPKVVLNEPRPLDLDLLSFGAEVRNSPQLVLPHPRAHLRRFVLQPWSELAPELVLPGQTLSISELLAALPGDEGVVRR
jgi:2-amino-4-hydroxy-6-hydroxymethyldihydropteridine diphosphokinase